MKIFSSVLGILLFLFLQSSPALAQGSEPPIPEAPTNGNVVLDSLDWLNSAQEAEINSINQKLDAEGIAQIAVITLDDCGDDKQKFRNELFRTWGIGHADDNDGLLILVCWYGGDQSRRSVEQETGYGLEGTLPDVLTARIANENFVPAFKANQPGRGLVSMVKSYENILHQSGQFTDANTPQVPLNQNLANLIIGILGSVPGLAFSMIYVTFGKSHNRHEIVIIKRHKRRVIQNKSSGRRFPEIKQIILAEIMSLIPISGLLYVSVNTSALSQTAQEYCQYIGNSLVIWLMILVLVYLATFLDNIGGTGRDWWNSGNDRWGSGNDGWGSGGDSFGGGDSGGGGSSTNF